MTLHLMLTGINPTTGIAELVETGHEDVPVEQKSVFVRRQDGTYCVTSREASYRALQKKENSGYFLFIGEEFSVEAIEEVEPTVKAILTFERHMSLLETLLENPLLTNSKRKKIEEDIAYSTIDIKKNHLHLLEKKEGMQMLKKAIFEDKDPVMAQMKRYLQDIFTC